MTRRILTAVVAALLVLLAVVAPLRLPRVAADAPSAFGGNVLAVVVVEVANATLPDQVCGTFVGVEAGTDSTTDESCNTPSDPHTVALSLVPTGTAETRPAHLQFELTTPTIDQFAGCTIDPDSLILSDVDLTSSTQAQIFLTLTITCPEPTDEPESIALGGNIAIVNILSVNATLPDQVCGTFVSADPNVTSTTDEQCASPSDPNDATLTFTPTGTAAVAASSYPMAFALTSPAEDTYAGCDVDLSPDTIDVPVSNSGSGTVFVALGIICPDATEPSAPTAFGGNVTVSVTLHLVNAAFPEDVCGTFVGVEAGTTSTTDEACSTPSDPTDATLLLLPRGTAEDSPAHLRFELTSPTFDAFAGCTFDPEAIELSDDDLTSAETFQTSELMVITCPDATEEPTPVALGGAQAIVVVHVEHATLPDEVCGTFVGADPNVTSTVEEQCAAPSDPQTASLTIGLSGTAAAPADTYPMNFTLTSPSEDLFADCDIDVSPDTVNVTVDGTNGIETLFVTMTVQCPDATETPEPIVLGSIEAITVVHLVNASFPDQVCATAVSTDPNVTSTTEEQCATPSDPQTVTIALAPSGTASVPDDNYPMRFELTKPTLDDFAGCTVDPDPLDFDVPEADTTQGTIFLTLSITCPDAGTPEPTATSEPSTIDFGGVGLIVVVDLVNAEFPDQTCGSLETDTPGVVSTTEGFCGAPSDPHTATYTFFPKGIADAGVETITWRFVLTDPAEDGCTWDPDPPTVDLPVKPANQSGGFVSAAFTLTCPDGTETGPGGQATEVPEATATATVEATGGESNGAIESPTAAPVANVTSLPATGAGGPAGGELSAWMAILSMVSAVVTSLLFLAFRRRRRQGALT